MRTPSLPPKPHGRRNTVVRMTPISPASGPGPGCDERCARARLEAGNNEYPGRHVALMLCLNLILDLHTTGSRHIARTHNGACFLGVVVPRSVQSLAVRPVQEVELFLSSLGRYCIPRIR
jgi:hypothetical protein